jgi:hypothetical protein
MISLVPLGHVDPDRVAAGQAMVRRRVLDAPLDPTAIRPRSGRRRWG